MIRCSVVGATGYTGAELIRILARHPHVKIEHLTTRSDETIKASSIVPTLGKFDDYVIEKRSLKDVARDSDVVFLALPHTSAMDTARDLLKQKKIVIDLSADFRIKNTKVYEHWYGKRHTQSALLKQSVYGLPEIYRFKIKETDLIANPGCYPTSVILGLYPLLREKLIDSDSIISDSKSGVSGAGKKFTLATHFSEANENFNAYKVNRHQHMPEIEQVLKDVAHSDVHMTFVPHLLPITRGILSTIYAKKKAGVKASEIIHVFKKYYDSEPFVRFRGEEVFPSLRDVQHTNFCDLGVSVDSKTGQVIIITAIDNLLKGASGQAIQNMNIRLGFEETSGLL